MGGRVQGVMSVVYMHVTCMTCSFYSVMIPIKALVFVLQGLCSGHQ